MPRDTTKARQALANKREQERRKRIALDESQRREAADRTCRWSRTCTDDYIEGSPFCYLHSKAAVGEARAYTSPDERGCALLFPRGRTMGVDHKLAETVRTALDEIEEESDGR